MELTSKWSDTQVESGTGLAMSAPRDPDDEWCRFRDVRKEDIDAGV